jgi:hypothetical protein
MAKKPSLATVPLNTAKIFFYSESRDALFTSCFYYYIHSHEIPRLFDLNIKAFALYCLISKAVLTHAFMLVLKLTIQVT